MTLMNPLGTMVGFVIPYAFISLSVANDNSLPWGTTFNQFYYYMVFGAGVAFVLLILTAIFMKDHKKPAEEVERERYGSIADKNMYAVGFN